MRKLEAFGDKIIAILKRPPERTQGGIILAETSQHATEAVVLDSAVDGICVDDTVLFHPDGGIMYNVDNCSYLILSEKEIMAVIREVE